MIVLPDSECACVGDRVSLAVVIESPVRRGALDAWLSTARGGRPARAALARQLVARDGVIPPLTLYVRDVTEQWPRPSRAWLVVSYAGTVIASGLVRLTR